MASITGTAKNWVGWLDCRSRCVGWLDRSRPLDRKLYTAAVSGSHFVSNTDQLQKMLLLIYVELAFLHLATSSHNTRVGNCKGNVILKCDGIKNDSFNSITWTKKPSFRIIRRSSGQKWQYNFSRTADLTDDNSLLLTDLTPEDSGTYECQIGAKPGGQNSISLVVLEVPVCVTEPPAPEPPAPEPPDLPLLEAVRCFLAICLLKLLLPVIVAQVFHCLRREVKSENPLPLS